MQTKLAARLLPLAIAIFLSPLSTFLPSQHQVYAADVTGFNDTARHWGATAISWGVQNNIVNGYDDGSFRPDQSVSEPEFLAMLLRAYPEVNLAAAASGSAWYKPYYDVADSRKWPVLHNTDVAKFNRGLVAQIITASQKGTQSMSDSIQYLLDQGLSEGKTAATVAGYQAADRLSRAEAVQFIRNVKQKQFQLIPNDGALVPASPTPPQAQGGSAPTSAAANTVTVKGIHIGDAAEDVITKLGEPSRKDLSEYGFQWFIYNQDYSSYAQIGISEGRVVGLYSTSANWQYNGLADGSAKSAVLKLYGQPLASITKGNTRFNMNYGSGEYGTYETTDAYVTFFYDLHRNDVVTSIQAIAKPTEQTLTAFYPEPSVTLVTAYERQIFDLANAARVKLGKPAFTWDDKIAGTARKHSADMAANNYFAHESKSGASPFDRMKTDGIVMRAAAENIAAGQTSAIFAHEGWMNSEGHRKNLLSDIQRLGVGVAFGGKMTIYYTQNFYTPQ
ncbi:copper amine oxidase [Paenibacillus sp. LMG 31456]|uniref:Copper amine oxidase n=1 Tax=Paenibacillus foliorum TaxID=2654974 RepID=A0A972K1H4_9BACL|nr:CAP-associated domain-containing protein [Paenibacillus foliorum]NOU96699.1 copper amine oxidase [Paenibacillus foliorum]